MSRLLVALHLAWVAACASTPPPQPDPFETAQAAHESPDGQIKLMHALPGTVSLKKSGIGYVVSAKASGMDLTCILGGLAQVDAGALLFSALRNTVDAWKNSPLGDGFHLDGPWAGIAGGYPVYGLRLNLKLKDGTVDQVPALVIAHHAARIYCVDSTSDDRNQLLQHGARIAQGLLWKGMSDHRLPGRTLMYLSQQSSRGRWPLGYQEEGLGRGSDGNLYFTESKLTFETGGAGGAFHSYDLGMRQAALPDGSLDEMSSALIKDGRMVRSATFQRLETGGYRITGVEEGQPIEETVEDLALTTHGAMRLWVKDQPVGATQTFLLPVAQRPWKLEARITVTKVAEDGSRTVELDEQWRGNRRRTRSIIGPGGLSRGLHWQLDEDTALVGTLAR